MTIYNFAAMNKTNKRYRVYDAHGNWIFYVKSCDTKTGEVIRYDMGDDPRHPDWSKVTKDRCAAVIAEVYAAPLVVVELERKEKYIPDEFTKAEPISRADVVPIIVPAYHPKFGGIVT